MLVNNDLDGGLKHVLLSISYVGCHPKPIDELHHFSRWLSHHQPEKLSQNCSTTAEAFNGGMSLILTHFRLGLDCPVRFVL